MRTLKEVIDTMPPDRRGRIEEKAERIIAEVDEGIKTFGKYPDTSLDKQVRSPDDVPSLHNECRFGTFSKQIKEVKIMLWPKSPPGDFFK